MDILAKIKFSEVVFNSWKENVIDGKRIIAFSENWLHLKFEEHTSWFSVFTISSEEIMYENEEYEVSMQFLAPEKVKDSIYVGKQFEGGYGGKLFFTGKILEVSEDFKKRYHDLSCNQIHKEP